MPELLDYRVSTGPAPNTCSRLAAATAIFLAGWFVGGGLKLLDVFYSGPGGAPNIAAHRTWWYIIHGVGAATASVGVVLALCGLRKRAGKILAMVALIANAIGLYAYGTALPYPN